MCHVLLVLQAGTGTWDGPAPRGAATAQALPAVAAAAAVHEPQHVTLCNGAAMPMIGLGTYKIESADVIRTALDVGFRNFDCTWHQAHANSNVAVSEYAVCKSCKHSVVCCMQNSFVSRKHVLTASMYLHSHCCQL